MPRERRETSLSRITCDLCGLYLVPDREFYSWDYLYTLLQKQGWLIVTGNGTQFYCPEHRGGTSVVDKNPTTEGPKWHLPPHAAEVIGLFGFPHGADASEELFWRTEGENIEIYADCSDVFWWATADVEQINEEDMPLLRQCLADLKSFENGKHDHYLAELYSARKRNRQPMPLWLERFSGAAELFSDLPPTPQT